MNARFKGRQSSLDREFPRSLFFQLFELKPAGGDFESVLHAFVTVSTDADHHTDDDCDDETRSKDRPVVRGVKDSNTGEKKNREQTSDNREHQNGADVADPTRRES
jgi:hypothetical protein